MDDPRLAVLCVASQNCWLKATVEAHLDRQTLQLVNHIACKVLPREPRRHTLCGTLNLQKSVTKYCGNYKQCKCS
jgi:hypothetical protein